jgi:pilus assembly protein Flp/PilA
MALQWEGTLVTSRPSVRSSANPSKATLEAMEGSRSMQLSLLKPNSILGNLISKEDGQDLIEYALVVALIAFGAVVGMQSLASSINTAFGNIGNSINSLI